MNNKPHFDRLNSILDILLKNKAPKDQYFFGTAAEIRKRTDWLKLESLCHAAEWDPTKPALDPMAIKFTYGGFTFHYYEIPEIAADNNTFQWTDELALEYATYYNSKKYSFADNQAESVSSRVLKAFKASKAESKKEWEILSSLASESSSDKQRIVSVRRLSDGEVFSVGDMVWNSAGPYRIGRFEESCPGHLMIIVDTGGSIDLKDARRVRNIRLPTEDPKKEDQPETFGIRLTLGDFMKLRRLLDSFEKV